MRTGKDGPANAAEVADLARIASEKRRAEASARRYAEALAADPDLRDDLEAANRYLDACSALLVGCGGPPPDDAGRAKLRLQAPDSLKADLALRKRQLESGTPKARTKVEQILEFWKVGQVLAGVRGPEALAKLPDEERKAWRALWTEVDALAKKAQGDRPRP